MRVVVIGGGLTGLVAAHRLADAAEVTVLEAAPAPGGQVRTEQLAGTPLDVGADAMLARRPEALELVDELGLTDRVAHPATGAVSLWTRRGLQPVPDGTVLGAPAGARPALRAAALGPAARLRAALEPLLPRGPATGDVSVGELVSRRYGRAVATELVDPLLSGVYAGRLEDLSTEATAVPLWRAAQRPGPLGPRLAAHRRAAVSGAPVFATLSGGLSQLIDALAARLGDRLRTSTPVRAVRRDGDALAVETDAGTEHADQVVCAVPAAAAADLVSGVAPAAADVLAGLRTASVAVVALAYEHAAAATVPAGSGVLVPRGRGRLVKAVTLSSRKWPQLADAPAFLLRASVGRVDDARGLDLDDEDLAARVDAEVREATGLAAPAVERRIVRWDDAMPQYDVGHRGRVAALRRALTRAPGLHVGGAALDGVGLPARVADGRALAAAVLAAEADRR